MINDITKENTYLMFPLLKKIKKNPNHFVIIDKYNYRLFKEMEFDIFWFITQCVEEYMGNYLKNIWREN